MWPAGLISEPDFSLLISLFRVTVKVRWSAYFSFLTLSIIASGSTAMISSPTPFVAHSV